jgi:hypothetical protein
MIRELFDELLSDHPGCAGRTSIRVLFMMSWSKNPAGLEGRRVWNCAVLAQLRDDRAHPGLRIRFVRFRAASMCGGQRHDCRAVYRLRASRVKSAIRV